MTAMEGQSDVAMKQHPICKSSSMGATIAVLIIARRRLNAAAHTVSKKVWGWKWAGERNHFGSYKPEALENSLKPSDLLSAGKQFKTIILVDFCWNDEN